MSYSSMGVSTRGAQRADTSTKEIPAESVVSEQMIVQQTLEQIEESALEDTMEMMGFVLGTKLQKRKGEDGKDSTLLRRRDAFRSLLSDGSDELAEWEEEAQDLFAACLSEPDPLAALQEQGISDGAIALLLGHALNETKYSSAEMKKLEKSIGSLVDGEDTEWILEMTLLQNMKKVPKEVLQEIKSFYRKTKSSHSGEGEEEEEEEHTGLLKWFKKVKDWPQREERLSLIIQALGVEMATTKGEESLNRLATTIADLKRLVYFLSITENASTVAKGLGLPEDVILEEILSCLQESWIYPEILDKRWMNLGITGDRKAVFYRCFSYLLQQIPGPCFKGELEKEALFDAVEALKDTWGSTP